MQDYLKRFFSENLKSSPKFGERKNAPRSLNEIFSSKNIILLSKNLREVLRERRFLYFTKKGPIEIVFNIKHYISAFILSLVFIFKFAQFLFFGISTFFNYVTYKNIETNNKKFTESEIQTLKDIAKDAINIEDSSIRIREDSEFVNSGDETYIDKTEIKIEFREKLDNIKSLVSRFGKSFTNEIQYSDEVIFDQFSGLANPEMIAIEHSLNNKTVSTKPSKINKKTFAYKDLPVIPFIAPRTKKLKIIHFTKQLDNEIMQLVNVFKSLNLIPDNIDIASIESLINDSNIQSNNEKLIEDTSLRFQHLEELKNAIIFLPLKPPMQYYYVSSPYGFRIHPKSKRRAMHHGIDMAGTWQEEVRAPADGYITSAGRNGSFGKTIKIIHKHGVSTLYGHLHKLTVKKGQFVQEGQIIGKMGSTGRAVGAHLHYEIKVNKKSVNPYDFISIGRELLSSSIIRR